VDPIITPLAGALKSVADMVTQARKGQSDREARLAEARKPDRSKRLAAIDEAVDRGDSVLQDLTEFVDTRARADQIQVEVTALREAIETARRYVLPSTAAILKELGQAADQVAVAAAADWRFGGGGNPFASLAMGERSMLLDFPEDVTDPNQRAEWLAKYDAKSQPPSKESIHMWFRPSVMLKAHHDALKDARHMEEL
jgi:hypothetical protein